MPKSSSSYLINRRAEPGWCKRCRVPLLVGLDEGISVRVDAKPIDRDAELLYLARGRRTYTLLVGGWLAYRDIERMRADGPIHVEHSCPR